MNSGIVALLPLLQKFVLNGISGGQGGYSPPRHLTTAAGLIFLSLLLVSVGLILTVFAEYIWLTSLYAPEIAALLTAATAFALAIVFGGVAKIITTRRKKKKSVAHSMANESHINQILSALSEEFETPIRENPKTAVLVAALTGFLAAEQIK